MANTVNRKLLLNGPRDAIMVVFLKSDGVSGELEKATLIDPVVDLGLRAGSRVSLQYLVHNFVGFNARLEFASGLVDNNYKWVLPENSDHPIDFSVFGGLLDDSTVDGTGELQITTEGFTAAGDQGSLIVRVRKY